MKKSVKRIVSFVSAIAMLSTTAMAVSAADVINVADSDFAEVTLENVEKADAEVFVITSGTKKLEEAAIAILKDTFKAEKATKNAIKNAAAAMDEDALKAAIDETTKVMADNADLKAAVEEAAAEIEELANAAADADKAIVITTVANPFAGFESSKLVDAAKAAAQVYVDEINAVIEEVAEDTGATIAEVEVPEVAVDINNIAASISDVLDAQTEAKREALENAEVEAEEFEAPAMWGDLNKDGRIRTVDLVIMIQGKLGILEDDADKYDFKAADVDRDGVKFSDGDVLMIKQVLLEDLDATDLGKIG